MTTRANVQMLRTVGFWLAAMMGLFQAINAVRAFLDPNGFAAYMGLPLAAEADVGFVLVYGLRTAFIAGLIGVLLSLKRLDALAWIALVALIMPIGDAWLAAQESAPLATILRHIVVALYVFMAFVFLRRAAGKIA